MLYQEQENGSQRSLIGGFPFIEEEDEGTGAEQHPNQNMALSHTRANRWRARGDRGPGQALASACKGLTDSAKANKDSAKMWPTCHSSISQDNSEARRQSLGTHDCVERQDMMARRPRALQRSQRMEASLSLLLALLLVFPMTCPSPALALSQICFEMVSNKAAIYLQEHPAKGRAAVAEKEGKIFLMTLPQLGGTKAMAAISTYLDLSARLLPGTETGLLSFAFHPEFLTNGRFFVSYICDASKFPDCKAKMGCVPPSACGVGPGAATTVIAEYSAGSSPLNATQLLPTEVRRILTYGRPRNNHMGGHIFFGKDSYLYLTSGDGGGQGDPNNLAQNMKSFFGKVMRMDVNKRTKKRNFTIPETNPFRSKGNNHLIYALGLRNPWRCDQHPHWGTIVCGDVGGDEVEEINVIVPRGNYEWSNYEGSIYHKNQNDTTKLLGMAKPPTFSYTHDELGGLGCIIGGVFSTSPANKCFKTMYLYADYSGPVWLSRIGKKPSTRRVTFKCAPKSPLACPTPSGDGSNTEWGEVYSWSRDRTGNAYLLTSSGIFRVAVQKSCGMRC